MFFLSLNTLTNCSLNPPGNCWLNASGNYYLNASGYCDLGEHYITNPPKCQAPQDTEISGTFLTSGLKFDNIDICFFSTGTWDPKKEKDIDVEQMEDVFKVNFFGTVNSIKAVEQYFRDKKNGIITIVSSIAGYRGLPNSTGYGPSKSALNNLAESLYFDFKRYNVRVCLVSPGFIKTPMTDKNDFKMPFLKTPEYAADQIYEGLVNKNIFEIHFPKSLTITLKLLSFLPSKIYFGLVGKLTKYQKK